jgi:hypothetical protein
MLCCSVKLAVEEGLLLLLSLPSLLLLFAGEVAE